MKKIAVLLLAAFFFFSCHKEEEGVKNSQNIVANSGVSAIYVLNEGLYGMNNSTISYFNFETQEFIADIFTQANGRGLGDTGNDLKRYGSKLYCVVTVSERLEIMNVADAKSIKQVDLTGKQPQKMETANGKVYVCCYDGTVVQIDTTTLAVEATVQVGRNPEGLCVANGKLYVSNSGGLDYPNYDNTISVIDLSQFAVVKTITVGTNPGPIAADHQGDVYVVSRGDYGDVPCTFQRIDTQIDTLVHDYQIPVSEFAISGNFAYLYSYNYATQEWWVKVMDVVGERIVKEQFIADGTTIQTPYLIAVNPVNGDIYIGDSYDYMTNADLYCFSNLGVKKFSIEVGLNPSAVVFCY